MSPAKIHLTGVLLVTSWVALVLPGFGAMIGLNFTGGRDGDAGYPPALVGGTAGAFDDLDYRQGNWNNLPGADGQTAAVINNSGAGVGGLTVNWVSGSTYTAGFGNPGTSPDDALMYGYLDDSGNPTPVADDDDWGSWLVVSNIPYSTYHVVIYASSDDTEAADTALGAYAVGRPDGRLLTRRTYGGHPGEFDSFFGWHRILPDQVDRDAVVADPFTFEGDHVVFPNLTESDLLIIAMWEDGSPWKSRGTIAAVQIVEASFASGDGDTLPDEWEFIHFGNLSSTDTDDPDGDGLVNTGELASASNPNLTHSDTDLLTDWEDVRAGFSPVLADTDGDGIPDDEDLYNGPDTDGDLMSDPWEKLHFGNLSQTATNDADSDLLENLEEHDARTDPTEQDTDGDDLWDGVETDNGPGSYVDPSDTGSDPLNPDTDVDSLLDGFEVTANPYVTDPTNSDTDGDGWLDQVEIGVGTDPTNSNSVPVFVAGQIAVNFPVGNTARFVGTTASDFLLSSLDTAGAPGLAQQNWNNAVVGGGAVNDAISNLVDEIGAMVPGMVVEYTAPTTWGVDGTVQGVGNIVNGDTRMLAGYLDDGNVGGAGSRVTLSNIPYAMYDVVLYFTGDEADGSGLSSYTLENAIGQRPPLIRDPIHALNLRPKASDYLEVPDTSTSAASAQRGNYTVFQYVRESTLTLVCDPATGRAPLCGFQIISRDPLTYPDLLDNDGMSDAWETNHFPGLTVFEILPGDDPDNDMLSNLEEFLVTTDPDDNDSDEDDVLDGAEVANGTDPNDPDTDGDTLEDGEEDSLGTDPLDTDTDNDGFEDGEEVNSLGTDPTEKDTDGDTFGDQIEVAFGTDPVSSNSVPPVVGGLSFQLRDAEYDSGQYDERLEPNEEAGLIPYMNWNDVAHSAAQPLPVTNQNGVATAAEIRWSLSNTFYPPEPWNYSDPDDTISLGYFDDLDACTICGDLTDTTDGIGVSVTVSSVPFSNYAVILYRNSDEGPSGQYGTYTVNGVAQTTGDTETFFNIGGWVLGRNALLYTGLTDSTLTIRIQSGGGGLSRGSLSGFQILAVVPQPQDIVDFLVSGGIYSLSWDSISGTVYKVESEGDIVGGPWSTAPGAGSISATNGTTSWASPAAGGNASFRVIRNPSP